MGISGDMSAGISARMSAHMYADMCRKQVNENRETRLKFVRKNIGKLMFEVGNPGGSAKAAAEIK